MRVYIQTLAGLFAAIMVNAACADNLYIRADAGYSWTWDQDVDVVVDAPPPNVSSASLALQSVPEGQLGFGYFWEPYLRFDITGVLTGNRKVGTQCTNTPSLCNPGTEGEFTINSQELFANVYYEMASIWTRSPTPYHPYVGFSLGSAHHITSEANATVPTGGGSFNTTETTGHGRWQFAWRATVGIAFMIADNLLLDVSYLYMDAGQAASGERVYVSGLPSAIHLTDTGHIDVKTQELWLGLRHQFPIR